MPNRMPEQYIPSNRSEAREFLLAAAKHLAVRDFKLYGAILTSTHEAVFILETACREACEINLESA